MQDPQTIELDCAPGFPRPSDLLPSVLEGTGLTKDPEDTVGRFFGCWTWDFSSVPPEQWAKVRPILKERITALHNAGRIRYGSW